MEIHFLEGTRPYQHTLCTTQLIFDYMMWEGGEGWLGGERQSLVNPAGLAKEILE